jgi:4-carboxymuconolactone decarboxylase
VARLDPIKPEDFTPEQKRVHADLLSTRKRVSGPFMIWLHNPALAEAANKLVMAIREHGKLEKRLYELIVLTVVRNWSAQYAWAAHEAGAASSGIAPDVIEALRARRKPDLKKDDERIVYDTVCELLERKVLSQPSYDRLLKQFGLDLTIEIITIAGMYSMVATVLNGFDAPTPNGEKPFG